MGNKSSKRKSLTFVPLESKENEYKENDDVKFSNFIGFDYLYQNMYDENFIKKAESDMQILKLFISIQKSLHENLEILKSRVSYIFQMNQALIPRSIKLINPSCIIYGYKVVRLCSISQQDMTGPNMTDVFPSKLKIVNDACAILKLAIDMYSSQISYGSHYELQDASKLDKKIKYCTNKCIVTGAQILSTADNIEHLFKKIKAGEIKFVSNMCVQFEYKLEHEVQEGNFGQKGNGCIQGIHFFLNPNKALSYCNNGFLADIDIQRIPTILSNELVEYSDKFENNKKKIFEPYFDSLQSSDVLMKQNIENLLGPSYMKHNYGVKELCIDNNTLSTLSNIKLSKD